MIIQCDHCNARFRMDDAKLANGPVKVRCAKCKEVFVVQPEEPAAENLLPPQQEPAPPAAESDESADFSFDAPAGSSDSFSQKSDDFSFDIEAPPASKDAASAQADSADGFDWQAGDAPAFGDPGTGTDFDLSSFDASLAAPAVPSEPAAAISDGNDFDFGEVDLTAQKAFPSENQAAAAGAQSDDFSMDFGEVSFTSQPTDSPGSAGTFSESSVEESSVFSDGSGQTADSSASGDFLLSFSSDTVPKQEVSAAAGKDESEDVNFGEFSFGDMGETAAAETAVPAATTQAQASGEFAVTGFSADYPEDELPPSSLTTRKKSASLFPLFVIVGAIILIIALAGSGVYFFGGPKAFSKVGLGFLVEWYGDKGAEDGSIALKGVTAAYTVNSAAGELFVVRGEAVNNFKKPRASIQIKVSLLGPGGTTLATKSAFCGNSLSNEQLTTLPLAKIEEIMNNQFGDSLANLGLKPGGTIPFVVVVSPIPKDASDYSVVVGGSTVATQ